MIDMDWYINWFLAFFGGLLADGWIYDPYTGKWTPPPPVGSWQTWR